MKNNYLIILFFLIFCFCSFKVCHGSTISAKNSKKNVYPFETGIRLFIADNNGNSILQKQWNKYLMECGKGFSNNIFLLAAERTSDEFLRIYNQVEDCVNELDTKETFYSSKWLKDIKSKFGSDYITEHRESIKFILLEIFISFSTTYCSEFDKELLYKELAYREIRNFYLTSFVEFVDSQDLNIQKKLSEKRSQAQEFLSYIKEKSFLHIIISQSLFNNSLCSSSLSNRSNTELKSIMIQHPDLNRPFSLEKAVTDLESYLNK